MTEAIKAKAVVLDRDGTLIDVVRDEDAGAVVVAFHPNQLRILPGVIPGLRLLLDAGFRLAIATNQPGPAKGQCSAAAVSRTNAALVSLLAKEGVPIETLTVCMHHQEGGPGGDPALIGDCACRKPKPGLIVQALANLGADPKQSWMVGDSAGDIEAGRGAGVRTGLVFASNRCELCPLRTGVGALKQAAQPDVHGPTLLEIARAIIAAPC